MANEIRIDYDNIGKLSMLFDFELREAVLLRKTAEPIYMVDVSRGAKLETDNFRISAKTIKYFDGKTGQNESIACNVGDSIFLPETSASGKILDSEELEKYFKKLSKNYRAKNKEASA